jgi:bacteriophage protein of unknown function (DUF646)|nr:MAG TPA: putative tail component [Caudoviricetes sp.]
MSDIISPDELAGILAECCKKYTDEVVEKVEEGIEKIAEEAMEEARSLSPEFKGKTDTKKHKKYKNSWKMTVKKTRGKFKATVHNRIYMLTWLLENGHLTRLGTGRKYYDENGRKYSQPFSHIAPANKHAQEKINKLLEDL